MNFTTVLFDVHSSCCAHAHGSNATMSNGKCYGSIRKRNFHLNYSLKVTHKVRVVILSFEKKNLHKFAILWVLIDETIEINKSKLGLWVWN